MYEITVSEYSKCKHYNVDYCRYKDKRKFKHPKEDYNNQACTSKRCPKRHIRSCRFGEKCKRRESCESIQKEKNGDSDISCLEKQVESLQTTVAEMMAKI